MKMVINTTWGGFEIPKEFCEIAHCDRFNGMFRTDERFIQWVEDNHPKSLGVVEIPDIATDWELSEYDGLEHIICVVNGKIYHLNDKSIWDTHDEVWLGNDSPDDWTD